MLTNYNSINARYVVVTQMFALAYIILIPKHTHATVPFSIKRISITSIVSTLIISFVACFMDLYI